MSLQGLKKEIKKLSSPERAKNSAWFFKTGKGEYGEGDVFVGLTVPLCRKLAQKYSDLELIEIEKLLKSKIHEERLIALLILVHNYQSGTDVEKLKIYRFYIKFAKFVNNWDLVDLSAHKIVGAYLSGKSKTILYKLARSKNLWEKRIAIISTAWFINNHQFSDTLKISKILLKDRHDLIHKAVGWMLREVGKKEQKIEEKFLLKHYKDMPRTMLRYAIERFPESQRLKYLRGSF
ncbi:MAG: DNA alkylation repair protein [Patescibacteria group bacterium]